MEYPDLGGRHSESGPVVVVGPRYSCGTNMASSLSGPSSMNSPPPLSFSCELGVQTEVLRRRLRHLVVVAVVVTPLTLPWLPWPDMLGGAKRTAVRESAGEDRKLWFVVVAAALLCLLEVVVERLGTSACCRAASGVHVVGWCDLEAQLVAAAAV